MLDKQAIDYILNYYSRFMTLKEAAATKHFITSYKFRETLSNDTSGENADFLQQKEWLSNDADALFLLKDRYEQFRRRTAERILEETSKQIYFNKCPKCDRLARTPLAKQCRFCGNDWHKQVVATFQIASAFQVTGRAFFLLGDILTGTVRIGMNADLTILGLAVKPIITAIEFAMHNEDGIVWEDTCLGFVDISEEDKEFLKSKIPFLAPIFIEDQNAS
jgi:hypothetical protein